MEKVGQALDHQPSAEEWKAIEQFLENSTWKARVFKTLALVGRKQLG